MNKNHVRLFLSHVLILLMTGPAQAGGIIPFAFMPLPTVVATPTNGYFVLGNTTYNGNLQGGAANGLAGADAKCLTELTAGSWLGKSSAGTLTQARVRAFLCTASTCQNPIANTKYIFASIGSPTSGGAEFTANASSRGPGNAANWSASTHFGSTEWYWTGRNFVAGETTLWPNTHENSCTNWTNGTSGNGTYADPNKTDDFRWNTGADPCTHTLRLICMVDP